MRAQRRLMAVALGAMLLIAGCGDKNPILMNTHASSDGPDEFAILPSKPLEMPDTVASLPEPTPGGSNRTDPTPKADAYAALGGRAPAVTAGAPAADSALLAHGSRYGVASDIRQTLAAEDLEYRRKHDGRLLERLFNVNVYYKAYRPMALDRYGALLYWRSKGVSTPAAPPEDLYE